MSCDRGIVRAAFAKGATPELYRKLLQWLIGSHVPFHRWILRPEEKHTRSLLWWDAAWALTPLPTPSVTPGQRWEGGA